MEKQTSNKKKKILWGVGLLIALVAVFAVLFFAFRPKTADGTKDITIEVIDNEEDSILYEVNTDAEYLQGAMEDAEGLTFSGTDGEFGLMIDTVNDLRADYEKDGAYWSFNINGEYCNYGISEQPVTDGDAFQIVYTPAQ